MTVRYLKSIHNQHRHLNVPLDTSGAAMVGKFSRGAFANENGAAVPGSNNANGNYYDNAAMLMNTAAEGDIKSR